ncbi:glycosyltransferase [Methylobacter psychrophilus]|uniref:glycosyltransferase n=1 Tax=Methylobacter psychrophilus TaxID=96941 RepID=UPI0021D4A4B7|nr:glycosyltransferase [Methylobacter psychrophilus]
MKILRIIRSVNPEGGGPIEGVRQLSDIMQNQGHSVEIVSLDAPDAPWVIDCPLTVHAMGPGKGTYGYSNKLKPWLLANVEDYDAVIINGIWQYHGFAAHSALKSLNKPYYLFTHGMLDPWFKRTYPLKHLKKWLYWLWAEYRVIRDARRVIFTCEDERLLAKQSFWLYKANEAVTAYGVANPPANGVELAAQFLTQYPQLQGKRLALYLSRIHVKKGCDLLIEAFAKVAKHDKSLHLVMAGPDQIGWVAKLQAQAEALSIADRITWPGMLQGEMKWGAFYAAEVFVLPSHQENFGIVVAEALACGKPVLISNKVNIWREIAADGAGLVADDTLAGTDDLLQRWLAMSEETFAAMQAKTIPCFQNRFHVQRAAERLIEIIRESL